MGMINFSFQNLKLGVANRDKTRELHEAYDKYLLSKDRASQYKLEVAFRHCYGKKASASLIDKLASTKWGALRSWDVFGYSTPSLIVCDYEKNVTTIKGRYKVEDSKLYPGLKFSLLLFLGALIFSIGAAFIAWHVEELSGYSISFVKENVIKLFILTFSVLASGLMSLFLGGFLAWKSLRIILADNHDYLVEDLHKMVSEKS
ncbi:hypothetical protein LPL18_011350 [Halomonas sp. CUBES01]|uniref:hypothetical protein n=1 Tax=Halomonas sp. CUBES01 TaxID=2897340 RepID=UPI001E400076|nr:hypothetical protein [Halomonas sp. CUBES01]MEC4767920.1 hypothetical protein [Halomonas sp. CUBES01]